jgi:Flp pilus assembly protein TadD
MGGSFYRRQSAIRRAKFFPVAGILLLLAGCAQLRSGQPSQLGDASGLGGSGVMNVADAAIAGGDPQMALKVSQSVLATDPTNLDALYHEGEAYYAINRCMDAIAVYKVALTVDPKSSDAELGIGRCLLKRNAAEAEGAFQAAISDNPVNAAALNDLGIARDLQGNHAGAVQPYQQALLINPGNLATEVNIGMSLALSGDGNDALQYLGPLATSPDATPKIREDYAAALVAAGRQDEARQVLAVDLPQDQIAPLINDFSAVIASSQAAASQGAPATASASYPAAADPVDTSSPVVQTALIAPPAVATAAPVALPAPVVTAAADPPPLRPKRPSFKPVAPAIVKTVSADPVIAPVQPSRPAAVAPPAASPQAASPQAASPQAASPPATAMVASIPAIPPSVDTPPSDNMPPAAPPAPPAMVKPASTPPSVLAAPPPASPPASPPKKAKSHTWWNLLRAPTGQ